MGVVDGAASGAAVGSVVPGIGTVAGGLVGGVMGLFGGDDAPKAPPAPPPIDPRTYWGGSLEGRGDDVFRYRQMGMRDPQAPVIDRTQSDAARGQELYGLNQQSQGLGYTRQAMGDTRDAMGFARDAAMGTTPSVAQQFGGKMIDDSIDSQMAMAASARGGPTAISGAGRQAAFTGAQTQQAGARDIAALRAQEMAQGRDQYLGAANLYGNQAASYGSQAGAYTGAASGIRGQDMSLAGMQADNEARQRQLTQQNQQFYERLGWDTNKQAQDSALGKERDASEAWARGRDIQLKEDDADWGKIKDVGNLVAGVGGAAISDMRAKENVHPISPGSNDDAMAQWSRSFGDPDQARQEIAAHDARAAQPSTFQRIAGPLTAGLSSFSGRPAMPMGGAYMPIKSDARSKYILSDDRTKLKAAFEQGASYATKHLTGEEMAPWSADDSEAEGPTPKNGGKVPYKHQPLPPTTMREPVSFQRDEEPAHEQPVYRSPSLPDQVRHEHAIQDSFDPNQAASFVARSPESPVPHRASVGGTYRPAARLSEDPMAAANRAQQGSAYTYKPGFAEASGQAQGEMNVGPMAQTMASDPIAATAVAQDPNTGLLALDPSKLSKLHSSGIASLQRQVDQLSGRAGRRR